MTEEQIRETFRSHKLSVQQKLTASRIRLCMVHITGELVECSNSHRDIALTMLKTFDAQLLLNTALAVHGVRDDDAPIQ